MTCWLSKETVLLDNIDEESEVLLENNNCKSVKQQTNRGELVVFNLEIPSLPYKNMSNSIGIRQENNNGSSENEQMTNRRGKIRQEAMQPSIFFVYIIAMA